MSQEFEMSLICELTFFFGLQIKKLSDETFVSQTKYALDLLKWFNVDNAKGINTPMSTSTKLDINTNGECFDQKLYKGMICSLLYLTTTRPDIMFSIRLCARFQSNPK